MTYFTIGLLIAAGAAIVAQNLLMVQISTGASSALVALVTNSAVGFFVLLILLVGRSGITGISEALGGLRLWHVLPGLLGSLFVFASLQGYQRLGAATTASILIATQLLLGLLVDTLRTGHIASYELIRPLAGVVLLLAGAMLITHRSF